MKFSPPKSILFRLFSGGRMFKNSSRLLVGAGLCLSLAAGVLAGNENSPKKPRRSNAPLKIEVKPVGPAPEILAAAKTRVERSIAVQSELGGTKYRLLAVEYVESGASLPNDFRAVFYDYTNDRTLVAEADFAGKKQITTRFENFQPMANDEEFEEAVRILQSDSEFAAALKGDSLKVFRPMPDVTVLDGSNERLVNVGLSATGAQARSEVVSVNLKRGAVLRYAENAPPTSKAAPEACGIPDANQSTTANGTAGQSQLTVTFNGAPLWEMLVIRPSASSGTRKSGIEIRDVKYKGKSVLKRGHAPVLNVNYTPNLCGPYRDWQWQEGQFQTPATGNTEPAPGIRILADGQTATTSLETGNDTGNFRGVAVYKQNLGSGEEVVLVTEMEAGWYRYIMEWRFAPDGTIRPRYGFGAVVNSCVCNAHNHHVYWRFDFDIVQPNNKIFQVERGRKFLKPIVSELKMLRSYQTNRSLLIQNSAGSEAYMLVPNVTDGKTDTFGVSDMWVLRYKNVAGGTNLQNEIDDGFNQTTSSNAFIQIDSFLTNESVADQDLVVWYGAHFAHTDGANRLDSSRNGLVISGEHVVGPDLRPVRW
jgi:hypothetical protein